MSGGRILGCVWLNAIDRANARASLGYWLRSSCAGQGIASEAARAVVRWAFETVGMRRIEVVVASENLRSRLLAERIGAQFEGVARRRLHVNGVSQDACIYSLLPEEFNGLREVMNAASPPKVDISVVIPVRDEAEIIPELGKRLAATLEQANLSYEVIFVTDTNRDNTVEVLLAEHQRNPRIKAIKLSTGRGQHIAVVAGLDVCRGDCAVLMDGDLQDLPEDIPRLYARMREGFDVVYGVKERKNDSALRNFLSKSFVRVMNWLSDQRLTHNTAMFRIISGRTIQQLRRFREHQQSLTGLMALINFPTTTVQVTSGQRTKGHTKYSFMRQVNMAIDFLLGFTTKPLRLISMLGVLVSGVSFAYLIVNLVQAIFFGIPVAGWATLVSLITFLSGVQLLALGTIGEYVGRIFLEGKRRPLYVVDKVIGILPPQETGNES